MPNRTPVVKASSPAKPPKTGSKVQALAIKSPGGGTSGVLALPAQASEKSAVLNYVNTIQHKSDAFASKKAAFVDFINSTPGYFARALVLLFLLC
ncbi:MAG: hypothetical protein NVS2B14_21610 [Chamaesiphon sp.]